ncbi:MAG TPA: PxKF domain-containing protein [Steroidobacteraceae bacterium]|nr:PxKF domain-containing protein [Steroidobacteraceae bacterium]
MTSKIPGLLAMGLLAGPIAAEAAVTFSTDTTTDLVGTFSVTGTSVEAATPSAFHFGLPFCLPVRVSRGTTAIVGLQCSGAPDDPRARLPDILIGPQASGSVSGTTSALAGSAVPTFYFRYSDLQDTGGSGGTFSGAFCFSRSENGCAASVPEADPATVEGFYPPVDAPSVATNEARAGQVIPLKFYAQTADGPIMDLTTAHLAIAGVACADISTAVDSIDEYATGAGVALENLGGGYYQYNWQTDRNYLGSCKTVALFLPDTYATPTNPVATFRFSR